MKTIIAAILFTLNISAQENPDFTVKTLDNENVPLKSLYEDGALLISFWALWCEPCKVEMRVLQSLYKKYEDNGFTILGINQDSPRSVAKVRSYIKSQRITFPVTLDPNNQYLQKMNGQSIPYTLLYDKEGNLVYKHIGYLPGDEIELEEEIKKLFQDKM